MVNSRKSPKAHRKSRAFADEIGNSVSEAPKQEAVKESQPKAGQELCLLNGVAASVGSGILGWVVGFGSGVTRRKCEGKRFQTSIQKGNSSAKTFGLLGGIYTFTACASKKLRGKDDGKLL
mmetsp:Transcript_14194/g.35932  ORF Transcript_14194/g.35932 Transcript_14194/m.35932 type:complete len:121 (-) Transcript_14194:397-759(-)